MAPPNQKGNRYRWSIKNRRNLYMRLVTVAIAVAFSLNFWINLQIVTVASSSASNIRTSPQDRLKLDNNNDVGVPQDDDSLKGYRAHVKDKFEWNRTQTTVGGAFVHMGKTGGSSLSVLLRNGCHSWLKHPCRTVANETLASKLIQSYYHVADFGLLPQSHHDFYVLTTRDPYDRTISAFVYGHFLNIQARNETTHIKKPHIRRDFAEACKECFPTLERFVGLLGGAESTDYNYPYRQNSIMYKGTCQNFARAVFHGKVRTFHHLFFHYRKIRDLIPDIENKVLLVTRLEDLWSDWKGVNQYLSKHERSGVAIAAASQQAKSDSTFLGSNNTVVIHKQKHIRNTADWHLPVTRDLSDKGRLSLCQALQSEYDSYFWLLSRARNLQTADLAKTLWKARKRCPKLSIDFASLKKPAN